MGCMSRLCTLVHEEGRLIDMVEHTPAANTPCPFPCEQRSSFGVCPRGWECVQVDCQLVHEEGRAIEEDWRSSALGRSAKGDDCGRSPFHSRWASVNLILFRALTDMTSHGI